MPPAPLVLGIDSSTQSCKALLINTETGEVVASGRAPHPDGTQVNPQAWIDALTQATEGLLAQADAVAIAGQQHGMVALDDAGNSIRDAMLWNDTSAATHAAQLVTELGGPQACAERVGSVIVASFTAAKLRWLRDEEPHHAARTSHVLLPHDYLTWHLGGRHTMTTDHGDASGTGYYSTAARCWLPEVAARAIGHDLNLPAVANPTQVVGQTHHGAIIAPGTGDNMAAALGLNLQPGDVCVSIGTSGVASAVVASSIHDARGLVAGFADATGNYLPLACTLNGARVLDLGARLLGVDHAGFDALALAAPVGASGITVLPYLDGERTPNRPHATGLLSGFTTATSREDFARAVVEGLLCSLRDAMTAVEQACGVPTRRVLLIGGGAQSAAVRQIAPQIFGVEVCVPQPAEYVALGAARQAAWVLGGTAQPPVWASSPSSTYQGDPAPQVVERYAALRDRTATWEFTSHDKLTHV